jgi:phage terminase large subunit-like protein
MAAQRQEIEEAIRQAKNEALKWAEAKANHMRFYRFTYLFPDMGPLRRELYKITVDWMNASADFMELVLFGGNRTGKTEAGAYKATLHATGLYPDWYKGRRFSTATSGVVAGKDGKTVRDTVQVKLIGFPEREIGTGMIPREMLVLDKCKKASGTPNLYDTLVVQHVCGDESIINLKSYDQKRQAFEGTKRHYVWEDEEAPLDIHRENVQRVFDHGGTVFNTYTPLKGQTELTRDLRKRSQEEDPTAYMATLTWDNVPHITAEQIEVFSKRFPPHEMKARRFGIPKMGSGAIFTTDFDDVLAIKPFKIPAFWPRAYGLDFGFSPHPTAAVWGAWDRESDIVYLYSEHRMKQELPEAHAAAIKMRGDWLKGNSETAGTNAEDGRRMINIYRALDLNLIAAEKAVESGIFTMRQRIETGRLRVFDTMQMWREEYESYHRVETPSGGSKIDKTFDDLMDATRYLLSRMETFTTKPAKRRKGTLKPIQFGDYRI